MYVVFKNEYMLSDFTLCVGFNFCQRRFITGKSYWQTESTAETRAVKGKRGVPFDIQNIESELESMKS